MPASTTPLPDEVEALRAMVTALQARNESVEKALSVERAKVSALDQHIAKIEQQLLTLRRARYGRSSEQLDQHIYQLELMLEDLGASVSEKREPGTPQAPAPSSKKPTARQPLPPHLPRDTRHYGIDSNCACCGEALVEIAQDSSEQLEYVPASFRVIKHVRPKYRCSCDDKIHQVDAPSRPIARGDAGPGLLAHVAIAKFCDHLPLYRHSAIYNREGVELSRSTLADWIGQICRLLRSLNNALQHYVLQATKVHTDDTPVPVLQPGRKSTK